MQSIDAIMSSIASGIHCELHEDLKPYLVEPSEGSELPFSMIRHPLIFYPMYTPVVNALINSQYIARAKVYEQLIEDGDITSVVFLHERPDRYNAYLRHAHLITDDELRAELLLRVWIDSEMPSINSTYWQLSFETERNSKVLTDSVRLITQEQADDDGFIKIYRGVVANSKDEALKFMESIAWTTELSVAELFATKFTKIKGRMFIGSTIVNVDSLFASCESRNEREIMVDMKKLDFKRIVITEL